MTEYGIFNDEGCVERGYWSEKAAQAAADGYDPDDEVYADALCSEHEQPYDFCDECVGEDEEEDE